MNVKPWMQSHECTATLCPLTPTQFFLNDAQWTLRVLVTQSYPTLRHPMDHSPPGSSVLGILQERHWSGLPLSSPGYLPNPGIKPKSPALQTDSLTYETPWKPDEHWIGNKWLTALSPAKRLYCWSRGILVEFFFLRIRLESHMHTRRWMEAAPLWKSHSLPRALLLRFWAHCLWNYWMVEDKQRALLLVTPSLPLPLMPICGLCSRYSSLPGVELTGTCFTTSATGRWSMRHRLPGHPSKRGLLRTAGCQLLLPAHLHQPWQGTVPSHLSTGHSDPSQHDCQMERERLAALFTQCRKKPAFCPQQGKHTATLCHHPCAISKSSAITVSLQVRENLMLGQHMLSCFSRAQLSNPMDCNLPGTSVHGVPQARILKRVAMPSSSRGSSQPRDQIHISYVSCTGRQTLPLAPPGKGVGGTKWSLLKM